MTARSRQIERIRRLLPGGIPRWIRVWEATIPFADKYTVVFTGRPPRREAGRYHYLGMSGAPSPFWPQGVGYHCTSREIIDCPHGWAEQVGRVCRHNPRLGRRITFRDLPDDCQRFVWCSYLELWGIPPDTVLNPYPESIPPGRSSDPTNRGEERSNEP